MERTIECPACGGPIEARNPGILMSVCPFCDNAVYWNEEGIRNMGKQAVLPEGYTRLWRGATGRVRGKRFEVLGRVRYSFGSGFWDEWFIGLEDGSIAWITEDDHELALEVRLDGASVPAFSAVRFGSQFTADGITFAVEESGQATCIGVEGALAKEYKTGEKYAYLDCSSLDGLFTLAIEYDDTPPTVYRGEWLHHDELVLDDDGEGW